MSYWITLTDADGVVEVPAHTEGGIIEVGGSDFASISITYNYSKYFYEQLDPERGIQWLYGKTGAEVIEALTTAVTTLGTETSNNYWDATPGNAGQSLDVLRQWALLHPTAVFSGD
jgi:hypothetical protein